MAKFKNLNPVAVVVTRGDGGRLYVGGQKVVEHKTGAGVKTHIRGSKADSKPSRAKPKKEVKSKSKAKPKKPNGLKKSKRAD